MFVYASKSAAESVPQEECPTHLWEALVILAAAAVVVVVEAVVEAGGEAAVVAVVAVAEVEEVQSIRLSRACSHARALSLFPPSFC